MKALFDLVPRAADDADSLGRSAPHRGAESSG